jgi:hypothetical protein
MALSAGRPVHQRIELLCATLWALKFCPLLMPHREAWLMESNGPSIREVGLIFHIGWRDHEITGIARLSRPLTDPHLLRLIGRQDARGNPVANNR